MCFMPPNNNNQNNEDKKPSKHDSNILSDKKLRQRGTQLFDLVYHAHECECGNQSVQCWESRNENVHTKAIVAQPDMVLTNEKLRMMW